MIQYITNQTSPLLGISSLDFPESTMIGRVFKKIDATFNKTGATLAKIALVFALVVLTIKVSIVPAAILVTDYIQNLRNDVKIKSLNNKAEGLELRNSVLEEYLNIPKDKSQEFDDLKSITQKIKEVLATKNDGGDLEKEFRLTERMVSLESSMNELLHIKSELNNSLSNGKVLEFDVIREEVLKLIIEILKTDPSIKIDAPLFLKFFSEKFEVKPTSDYFPRIKEIVLTEKTLLNSVELIYNDLSKMKKSKIFSGRDLIIINRLEKKYHNALLSTQKMLDKLTDIYYNGKVNNYDLLMEIANVFESEEFVAHFNVLKECRFEEEYRELHSLVEGLSLVNLKTLYPEFTINFNRQVEDLKKYKRLPDNPTKEELKDSELKFTANFLQNNFLKNLIPAAQRGNRYKDMLEAINKYETTTQEQACSIKAACEKIHQLMQSLDCKRIPIPETKTVDSLIEAEKMFSVQYKAAYEWADEMRKRTCFAKHEYKDKKDKLDEIKSKYEAAFKASIQFLDFIEKACASEDCEKDKMSLLKAYFSDEYKKYNQALEACKSIKFRNSQIGVCEILLFIDELDVRENEDKYDRQEAISLINYPVQRLSEQTKWEKALKEDLTVEQEQELYRAGAKGEFIEFPKEITLEEVKNAEKKWSEGFSKMAESFKELIQLKGFDKREGLLGKYLPSKVLDLAGNTIAHEIDKKYFEELEIYYEKYKRISDLSAIFINEMDRVADLNELQELYKSNIYQDYSNFLILNKFPTKPMGNKPQKIELEENLEAISAFFMNSIEKDRFSKLKQNILHYKDIIHQRIALYTPFSNNLKKLNKN